MPESSAISVIIPTYNASKFLREALDSLVAQSFTDWEAVCVNDGSTDDSLSILQEYAAKDSRFRILDGPNGGYGKAMNRGMDAAQGRYMAILEPDDILPCRAYEQLIKAAESYQAELVRGATCRFYQDKAGYTYQLYQESGPMGKVFRPLSFLRYFRKQLNTWSYLYRLDFLQKHGIRYRESPGAAYQDTGMFYLSGVCAERVVCIPDITYLYRIDNPSSSVNNAAKQPYVIVEELKHIRKRIQEYPESWIAFSPIFPESFYHAGRWMAGKVTEEQRIPFLKRFREELAALTPAGGHSVAPDVWGEMQLLLSGDFEAWSAPKSVRSKWGGLLRMTENAGTVRCSLLGIPLMYGTQKEGNKRYKLFGFLPLASVNVSPVLRPYEQQFSYIEKHRITYRLLGIMIKSKELNGFR